MRITIFLLLLSANVFAQTSPAILSLDSMPYILGRGWNSNPWGKSEPVFVRVDTTHGAVTFLKKDELVATFTPAIKIDSVWMYTERTSGGCDMGNGVSCLVLHTNTRTITGRRIVAVITKDGKHIDLSKHYTFIPESEMQD